jgi:hypothetical protein
MIRPADQGETIWQAKLSALRRSRPKSKRNGSSPDSGAVVKTM